MQTAFLLLLGSSDISRIIGVAVTIFLLLCADVRSFPTCLRGMSWWRTLHWRPLLYAEEVAGSHAWVLSSHLLCLVAGTCGYFGASSSVTMSEVKVSPHNLYTITGVEASSIIRTLSPNCGCHIYVKVTGQRRLCHEEPRQIQLRWDAWNIWSNWCDEDVHKILVGNPEVKRLVGRPGRVCVLQVNR